MSNAIKDAAAVNIDLQMRQEAFKKAQEQFLGQRDCPECDGTGEVEVEVGVASYGSWLGGELETQICECENCDGNGWVEFDGMDDENWEDANGN